MKVGKLGRTDTLSQDDSVKIKECRIIYRRSGSQGPPPDFSQMASLTPAQYVDPNALARKGEKLGREKPEPGDAKHKPEKAGDRASADD